MMKPKKKAIVQPVILVILDGWGVAPKSQGNAISLALTPNFKAFLKEYPSAVLRASGRAIGLPEGAPGNSTAGHLTLGLGRSTAGIGDKAKNGLVFALGQAGKKLLMIAETEKYSFLGHYFKGGETGKATEEDMIIIPSITEPNYASDPKLLARQITKQAIEAAHSKKYDLIVVNYANLDLIGHTGDLAATTLAVEIIDKQLKKYLKLAKEFDDTIIISADHGNAEQMVIPGTHKADPGHTINPVPFIVAGKRFSGKTLGWPDVAGIDQSAVPAIGSLEDVAPTILRLMAVPVPDSMTGKNLIGGANST